MDVAAIRPDDWNLALLIHVVGATVLVGALCLALTAMVATWRGGTIAQHRLGLRALLWVALPGWIAMRVGAQWIADEQGIGDDPPGWITMGFVTSETSVLLIVAAAVLAWLGVRRGAAGGEVTGARARAAAALVGLSVALYVVAIWAMTTKPG